MPLEENTGVVRKQHALEEAKRVADNLCLEFPHAAKEECRDVAEEALLEWCERLDQNSIEEPGHPYTWLYNAASHRLVNYLKRTRHLAGLEAMTTEPSHEPEANEWEMGRDFVELLFAAGLDPHERATVRMKTAFGQSWKEIAAHRTDGKSADALRQTYHRALKKLKRYAQKEQARALGKQPPPPQPPALKNAGNDLETTLVFSEILFFEKNEKSLSQNTPRNCLYYSRSSGLFCRVARRSEKPNRSSLTANSGPASRRSVARFG